MKKSIRRLWQKIKNRFTKPKLIVTTGSFSGDTNFIDIRYWVSHPEKINSKSSPVLITSGNDKLYLLRLSRFGSIKSNYSTQANTGILLFYNKNIVVKEGDKVTLYWDGFQVEDIVIKSLK